MDPSGFCAKFPGDVNFSKLAIQGGTAVTGFLLGNNVGTVLGITIGSGLAEQLLGDADPIGDAIDSIPNAIVKGCDAVGNAIMNGAIEHADTINNMSDESASHYQGALDEGQRVGM